LIWIRITHSLQWQPDVHLPKVCQLFVDAKENVIAADFLMPNAVEYYVHFKASWFPWNSILTRKMK